MNRKIRFTKPTIESLPPAPAGKRDYYEDSRLNSLRLRLSVTDRGSKSWVVQRRIDGRVSRVTLGGYPDLTPELAIKAAERLAGKIASGENPQAEQRNRDAKRLTLNDALELMLKVRGLKPGTEVTYRNLVKGPLNGWANKPLVTISPEMIAERHAKLSRDSGGAYANSAMRTLRSIWNFAATQYEDAKGQSLLPPNPVSRLSKAKAWVRVSRRKTYIEQHQLVDWFSAVQALRAEPWGSSSRAVGDYLILLVLSGLRRTEAASLRWQDIDLKAKLLRLQNTKNHDEHVLPLSDYLFELLDERRHAAKEAEEQGIAAASIYVFPADNAQGYLSEPRAYVDKVKHDSGVRFMLHDLRRTFSTVAESLDLSHYALKRLLNHRMAGDVTAGYIGSNVERLRGPMQQITDTFLALGGVRASGKVVSIASRQPVAMASPAAETDAPAAVAV